jgi:hypothetical protein
LAGSALAAPFCQLSILGSTSPSGPYTSTLTVTPGETIYYEVQLLALTSVGSTYTNTSITVAGATIGSSDGVNSLASLDLLQTAANGVALSFNSTTTGTGGSVGGGIIAGGFDGGTGVSGGAPMARGATGYFDLQGVRLVQATGTQVLPQTALNILSGSFTVMAATSGGAAQLSGDMLGKNITGGTGATTSGLKIGGTSKVPSVTVSDGTLNSDGTRTLPTGNDPAFTWVPLVLNALSASNNSILTLPPTVNLGKVIQGDPIPASQTTTATITNAGTNDGHFSTVSAGGAFAPATGDVPGSGTLPITVGSTATPSATGTQNVGTVTITNTDNSADTGGNKMVTLQANVLSRASNSVIAQTGGAPVVAISFDGGLLMGGKMVASAASAVRGVIQTTPDGSGGAYDTTALVTADGAISLATGTSVPVTDVATTIPFTVNASGSGSVTLTGNIYLKNGAADSYAAGRGSVQPVITIPVSVSTNVGTAFTLGTDYGQPLGSQLNTGDSYAGLSSKVQGSKNTSATLLAGTASANQNITEAWRQATVGESQGANHDPGKFGPGFNSSLPYLISDVVELTGATGTYVLEMSFDPTLVPDLRGAMAQGDIQLATFEENAQSPNFGKWVPAEDNAAHPDTYMGNISWNGDMTVGHFGVDTSNGQFLVWEVLDHDSQFAVVPEPATIGILGLSVFGLTIRRRRRTA